MHDLNGLRFLQFLQLSSQIIRGLVAHLYEKLAASRVFEYTGHQTS